jgi:hypothetical protein
MFMAMHGRPFICGRFYVFPLVFWDPTNGNTWEMISRKWTYSIRNRPCNPKSKLNFILKALWKIILQRAFFYVKNVKRPSGITAGWPFIYVPTMGSEMLI